MDERIEALGDASCTPFPPLRDGVRAGGGPVRDRPERFMVDVGYCHRRKGPADTLRPGHASGGRNMHCMHTVHHMHARQLMTILHDMTSVTQDADKCHLCFLCCGIKMISNV